MTPRVLFALLAALACALPAFPAPPDVAPPPRAVIPPGGDLADWTGMPGIESESQLWDRIDPCLQQISNAHPDQDVLLATHGGVLARALYHTLAIPDGQPRRFALSNGIVAILQWRSDHYYLLSLIDPALLAGSPPTIDTATVADLPRPS